MCFRLFLTIALCAIIQASAQAKDMTFRLETLDARFLLMGLSQSIFADGTITIGTADHFKAFVNARKISGGATVYLNSDGGALTDGIKLGTLIRDLEFNTNIGRYKKDATTYSNVAEGRCLSACTLAFIGGVYRYNSNDNSIFGVHRFYFKKEQLDAQATSDISQLISALVVEHIRKLGVDTRLFSVMSSASRDEIIRVPKETLISLHVINNGIASEKWEFASNEGVIWLRGEQNGWNGTHKIVFYCDPSSRSIIVGAFFNTSDPTSVATFAQSFGLMIDGKVRDIPSARILRRPYAQNRYVQALAQLSREDIMSVLSAKSLGFSIQPPNKDIYFGFDMNFENGKGKFRDIVISCSDRN